VITYLAKQTTKIPPLKKGVGGFCISLPRSVVQYALQITLAKKPVMLQYEAKLKKYSRSLRQNMTDAEKKLWSRLRGKQLLEIQFYRQKPIGTYITDFYAPKAQLVIEIDGSQHFDADHIDRDKKRDDYLQSKGLIVLRFHNLQVLKELEGVIEVIFRTVASKIRKIPLPPFSKGEFAALVRQGEWLGSGT